MAGSPIFSIDNAKVQKNQCVSKQIFKKDTQKSTFWKNSILRHFTLCLKSAQRTEHSFLMSKTNLSPQKYTIYIIYILYI